MSRARHFRTSIVSAFVLLSISVSCDNDKTPSPSPCETNPGNCQSVLEAKDFFLFKQGSWWVYEEETSHERDSMYVTQYLNNSSGYDFDCRIKSALTDYEYHYWPVYYGVNNDCSTSSPVYQRCLHVKRGKGKFQDNLGESSVFFVRYFKGDFVYTGGDMNFCPNNTITIAELYDSLDVNGSAFYNVVRVDEACCFQEGKQPTKFYHARGIGIIRKELLDSNQVWNLVNYHIEE